MEVNSVSLSSHKQSSVQWTFVEELTEESGLLWQLELLAGGN